ncbi:GGDEF domain-containing protein [Phosphitispora sp. TUW77]|uniref:GGDEF domain-containing protein n=1 Tax=Phosphitispora sp. TUW77 TaxID=3152361 RepID=UPI003AB6A921
MFSVPYKYKLIALVQLIVLIALILLGVVSYRKITSIIEKETGMRACGVALAASYLVNTRMDEYLELDSLDDENTPFYKEMKKLFQEFKASNNLMYVYTEKRISEDRIIYVLDAEPVDSENFSHIGDEDYIYETREKAYASGKLEYSPLFHDPVWGDLITGYAPLINPKSGEQVGLLGVDIDAKDVLTLFREILFVIIVAICIIFAFSFIAVYKLADMITKPMYIDSLTGAYNHKFFQENLAGEISRAAMTGKPLSMIMMDLDYFKNVNDQYGHRFGDIVLRSTAKVMKKNIRPTDILARYGGEEFAAILPNTESFEASAIASRIRHEVEKQLVHCEEFNTDVNVTISIGVAQWSRGIKRDEFIDMADKAMYESKHMSRNRVTTYTEGYKYKTALLIES